MGFMKRIAIMGAGSLGIVIGAYLANGRQDVELIAVTPEHVKALNERGATVTGTVQFTTPVKAITPDEMTGQYDLVLLLTKLISNEQVLRHLIPFLHNESIVLSLQNGIPEDRIASYVGKNRVIGGSVEFGATWLNPGVSELTTEENALKKGAFQIGELDGQITDRLKEIKSILDLVGKTSISNNLQGTKWSKLLVNAAMSGMSAALGGTFGDVLSNDIAVRSAACLADETIKAGHSVGVEFTSLGGFDLNIFEIKDPSELSHKVALFQFAFKPQALLKASMLQDLEKKRWTEIDQINGVIPLYGNPNGIKTPFNDLVIRLVKQAEKECVVPKFEQNIAFFEELLQQW
jgi:2-dehydropantoate 2-reductase